jgi:hypothetical protein
MTSFIYWTVVNVHVSKRQRHDRKIIIVRWPTYIKCSDYFDKFSLLTHTDEQNLYFDNFFYDKCTCPKASMLAFEQVHLS